MKEDSVEPNLYATLQAKYCIMKMQISALRQMTQE